MGWISLLSNLLGSAANFGINAYNRKQDREMIAEQNEYNTPANQLQRAAEAGINPNAAIQGITGAASFGNMQESSFADMTPIDGDSIGQLVGGSVNSALQADVMNAQFKYYEALKDNLESNTEGNNIDNMYKPDMYLANLRNLDLRNTNQDLANKVLAPYANNAEAVYNMNMKQLDASVSATVQSIKASIANVEMQSAMTESNIALNKSTASKNYADASNTRVQTAISQAKLDFMSEYGVTDDDPNTFYFEQSVKGALGDDDAKSNAEAFKEGQSALVAERTKAASDADYGSRSKNDPQFALMKQLERDMDGEIAEVEKEQATYRENSWQWRECEKMKKSIRRKYGRKMRRLHKGMSIGGSAFGFGANVGT